MSIQFIRILDSQAIGSIVYTLNDTGSSSFIFISNPGDLFTINGYHILVKSILTIGVTSIIVEDANGNQLTMTFDIIAVAPFWRPGDRPFTVTSPINIPIPVGMPLQKLPWDPLSTGGTGFYTFSAQRFTFDVPDENAPLATVTGIAFGQWGNPPLSPDTFPMTAGFTGSGYFGDVDKIAVSIVNGVVTEYHNFDRVNDNAATASYYGKTDALLYDGFGWPNFDGPGGMHAAGPVATGSNVLCGAVLKQECDQHADIKHALACTLHADYCSPGPYSGAYPPAIAGDGNRSNGMISEGQFLAIPKTTTAPTGLSSYGLQVFKALQDYGMFINDTSGGTGPIGGAAIVGQYAASSWTLADRGTLNTDAQKLVPLLQKVGYVLDGLYTITYPWSSYSPQLQLLRYTGSFLQVSRDTGGVANIGPTIEAAAILNTASISSFCAGTIGRVSQCFDQIGNSAFISTGASSPIIFQSGSIVTLGGQAAMLFDGTNYFRQVADYSPQFSPNIYFNTVIQVADFADNYALIGFDIAGGIELRIQKTTGLLEILTNNGTSIFIATILGAIPLNTPLVIELAMIFGSPSTYALWVNRVQISSGTNAVTSAAIAGKILIGSGGPGAKDTFKGLIGCWTISNVPQSRPQYVQSQYLVDFWNATYSVVLTILQDSFTDVNGTLLAAHTMNKGPGWTDIVGNHQIQSNTAQPGALVSNAATSGVNSGFANYHLSADLTPIHGGFGSTNVFMPTLIFRMADVNNYWMLRIEGQSNVARLYRVTGGSFSAPLINLVASYPSGTASHVQVITNGSSIIVSANNGAVSGAFSDSTFSTATIVGIKSDKAGTPSGNCKFDNLLQTSP